MFRLRSIFLFFLMALILPYGGASPVAAAQLGMPDTQTIRNYINLYIDEIKLLGNTGDLVGAGEFRLIILAADTTGKSSGMFCLDDKPLIMSKGEGIKSPCPSAASFDEARVSDDVYFAIMMVDEDKSLPLADLSYEAAANGLSSAFGKAVKMGALSPAESPLTRSTPFTFGVEVLFNFLSGKLKQWIQEVDIIGVQGIYLSRKDNWSANKTTTIESKDGGIQITYTIVHTSYAPSNQNEPVLAPAPIITQGYWCDDLSNVKLKVGDRAKVLWLKVNLRTAPIVPQEYYENSITNLEEGTTITIIGGPTCAHEGTWWRVLTQDGQIGWVREFVRSSGYLIGQTTEIDEQPTFSLSEIDKQLEYLLKANIAFNKPEKMRRDEVAIIELILNLSMSQSALATQLVERGGLATSTADPNLLIGPNGESISVETSRIEITPRMKASLVSQDPDAFIIIELHDDVEQVVSSIDTTAWRWSILAKKAGQQTLELIIYRLVKYDGNEYWREIETYKASIAVEVTVANWVKSLDWQWIAMFILAFVGSILGILNWLNNRNRIDNSKRDEPRKNIKKENSKKDKPVKKVKK